MFVTIDKNVMAVTLVVGLALVGATELIYQSQAAGAPRPNKEPSTAKKDQNMAGPAKGDLVKVEVNGQLASLVRDGKSKSVAATVYAGGGEFFIDASQSKAVRQELVRLADTYIRPGSNVVAIPRVTVLGRLEFRATKVVGQEGALSDGPKAWFLVADSLAVSKSQAALPAEQLKALLAEYEAASREHEAVREAYRKAINDDDNPKKVWAQLLKVRETFRQQREKCAADCLKLADKHPDAPAALDALFWVVKNTLTGNPGRPENVGLVRPNHQAFDLLRRDHIDSEKLAAVCRFPGMGIIANPQSVKFLEELLAKSPHPSVRAQALLRLSEHKLSYSSTFLRTLRNEPEKAKRMEPHLGKELLRAALAIDPERMRREGEQLYERLAKEYGDLREPQAGTLSKLAALKIAALRQPPAVGQLAPGIEGADIDGKKLKLSDYRGKVVLLAFTGDWCAACDDLHPQQRSLAKKFVGKTFTLLDVNSDVNLNRRKSVNAKEPITWRAFQWTDAEGAPGPVATRWGIDQWPTLFLIDHRGVIRQRYIGSTGEKVLAEALDKAIRDAEAEKKP
jgi:peroxiredoxin